MDAATRTRRLDRHSAAVFETLMTADPELGGSVHEIAGAVAILWPAVAVPLFNHVTGLGNDRPPTDDELARILALYKGKDLPCYVQLSPLADVELGSRLKDRGLELHPSWAVMALTPESRRRYDMPPSVSVELVDDSTRDDFVRVLLEAFQMGPPIDRAILASMGAPDVYNFLARFEGEPAGCGQLVIREGVGGLFSGGVLEPFRRRGIHGALINARIEAAMDRGQDLLYSETEEVGNQSSRDLTRMGFFQAYEHVNWSLPVTEGNR